MSANSQSASGRARRANVSSWPAPAQPGPGGYGCQKTLQRTPGRAVGMVGVGRWGSPVLRSRWPVKAARPTPGSRLVGGVPDCTTPLAPPVEHGTSMTGPVRQLGGKRGGPVVTLAPPAVQERHHVSGPVACKGTPSDLERCQAGPALNTVTLECGRRKGGLLHRNRLGQVAGLVHVGAL